MTIQQDKYFFTRSEHIKSTGKVERTSGVLRKEKNVGVSFSADRGVLFVLEDVGKSIVRRGPENGGEKEGQMQLTSVAAQIMGYRERQVKRDKALSKMKQGGCRKGLIWEEMTTGRPVFLLEGAGRL